MSDYMPSLRIASRSTSAGLSPTAKQRFINSSTVGLPCFPSLKSSTRAGLTLIARANARNDILRAPRVLNITRMSSVSIGAHMLTGLVIYKRVHHD